MIFEGKELGTRQNRAKIKFFKHIGLLEAKNEEKVKTFYLFLGPQKNTQIFI